MSYLVYCFDLDDTLFSEIDYVESGLRAVGAHLGLLPGGRPAADWLVDEWRRTRAGDLFQQVLSMMSAGPERLGELKRVYRTHNPTIRLRPNVRETLDCIVQRSDRLSLISDGWIEVQQLKWKALEVRVPFEPVIFTDERGRDYWKPHPWAFERVMEVHRVARGYAYIADNPAKDFIAPIRLGWRTIMVRNRENVHSSEGGTPAEHAIEGIGQLQSLIDKGTL